MEGYIYYIINQTNGKRYVGQTIQYDVRKKTHLNLLRNNRHYNRKLQNAWNLYGEENFLFEVEVYNFKQHNDILILEVEKIKKYNSYYDGYNLTIGGEGQIKLFFNFEEYCFIKTGNLYFKGMYNRTAELFDVHSTTISDIVNDKTYSQFQEDYNQLSNEIKGSFLQHFIEIFSITEDNIPKIPNEPKASRNDLFIALCISEEYQNIIKTLEQYLGYTNGVIRNIRIGKTYKDVLQQYNNTPPEERKNIANIYYQKWNLEALFLDRQLKQGGSKAAYLLKDEDIYFAFYCQEQGISPINIANHLNVAASTVRDWFRGKSRKKQKQFYPQYKEQNLNLLIGRFKIAELNGKP